MSGTTYHAINPAGSVMVERWQGRPPGFYTVSLWTLFANAGTPTSMMSLESRLCVADDFGNLVEVPQ